MTETDFKLYHYWRSSSSWRIRWALAIKNLRAEYHHVGLLDGESEAPAHRERNPLGLVPVLEIRKTRQFFIESTAIIEYLDELYPEPSLIGDSAEARLQIRALAQIINADIQPIQGLAVLDHLSADPGIRKKWAQHWIHEGFNAYEKLIEKNASLFSFGDRITLADLCLIPQCYNAERFGVNLAAYPQILRIYRQSLETESCQASHPERFKPADFVGA